MCGDMYGVTIDALEDYPRTVGDPGKIVAVDFDMSGCTTVEDGFALARGRGKEAFVGRPLWA